MHTLKAEIDHANVRNVIIEACAIHALRKEIKERIPEITTEHLTDAALSRGRIRVHGGIYFNQEDVESASQSI